jgi:TetR/AcrR family transcriptional regulator, transcriptional repressor of bet genes
MTRKVAKKPSKAPPRASRERQRQRLIDACISALYEHGPSRTTVERVTAIARMSPGIVRFYFESKAAMLIASLQFLADEFEQQLLIPVSRMKRTPVAALQTLVDLYLDSQLASPRKVSVWYSFWGEASSRAEYYDLCGQKDQNFAALTRDLIGRLILQTGQSHLDADGVALGLIGVLEVLWQDIAFQDESRIDRKHVKRRAMAYLHSVFPGQFEDLPPAVRAPATAKPGAAEPGFSANWHLAAHVAQLPAVDSHVLVELSGRLARITRDSALQLSAHWDEDRSQPLTVCERDGFIFLRALPM